MQQSPSTSYKKTLVKDKPFNSLVLHAKLSFCTQFYVLECFRL